MLVVSGKFSHYGPYSSHGSSYTVGGSRSFAMICNRTNCITTIPSDRDQFYGNLYVFLFYRNLYVFYFYG